MLAHPRIFVGGVSVRMHGPAADGVTLPRGAVASAELPRPAIIPRSELRKCTALTRLVAAALEEAAGQSGAALAEIPVVYGSEHFEVKTTLDLYHAAQVDAVGAFTHFLNARPETAGVRIATFLASRAPWQALSGGPDTLPIALCEALGRLATGAREVMVVLAEEAIRLSDGIARSVVVALHLHDRPDRPALGRLDLRRAPEVDEAAPELGGVAAALSLAAAIADGSPVDIAGTGRFRLTFAPGETDVIQRATSSNNVQPSVTARSIVTCLGAGVDATVSALAEGRSGLGPPPFSLPFPALAGAVPDSALAPLPAALAAYDSRALRLAARGLDEIRSAVEQAIVRHGRERVAIVVGTSNAWVRPTRASVALAGAPRGPANDTPHSHFQLAHGVRALLGADGPVMVLSSACIAGGRAFAAAARLMAADLADAAIVGGVDVLSIEGMLGFARSSLLSAERARPFSAVSVGRNLGEGAAFALLERDARADVHLLGWGETSDGTAFAADHEGHGLEAAIREALGRASLTMDDIGLVNANAKDSPTDIGEIRAVLRALGTGVPIVSTKPFTGSSGGAESAIEAVLSVLASELGWAPASLGAAPLAPEVSLRVGLDKAPLRAPFVINNANGGGGNTVLIFGPRRR
ncbi:MAG: beta-ketoacyl synthase N-terminal-like domain-containing protein [Byssovorax sp.]